MNINTGGGRAGSIRIGGSGNQGVSIGGGEAERIRLGSEGGSGEHIDAGSGTPMRIGIGAAFVPTGSDDYEDLRNKPKINGVTLIGDKTSGQLGIVQTVPLTNAEIEGIFQNVINNIG